MFLCNFCLKNMPVLNWVYKIIIMEKWNKYLSLLGLHDSEITVYLNVLKSGPSPVQDIAKETKLSRVTGYSAIGELTKQGLMTSVEKGKKQVYAAEPPERIVSLADTKMNSLKTIMHEIKDNIDELKLVQSGDKPIVKMFEGLEAFGAIQEDVLSQEKNINLVCEFGNLDEIEQVYPYEKGVRETFFKKLSKMKMKRNLIFLSKEKKEKYTEDNKTIKFLNNDHQFYGDIFFYNDTIWLSSFKSKQISVMIKSKEIKDTLQAAFDLLWESLA